MNKKIQNESPLDELRICRFCGRVFKDGETEVTINPDGGITAHCPYCDSDQFEFNKKEK